MARTPALEPHQRLVGERRDRVAVELLRQYERGRSIREICERTGYSIGRVRRLLVEAGVVFRDRGGKHPA
jgi:hypothetical protein